MGLPRFSRLCVFLLLAYGVSGTRGLCTDDVAAPAPDLNQQTLGSAADQGRLAWAILEAIEQNHIEPPPRHALLRVITRAFLKVPKDALKDVPHDELDAGTAGKGPRVEEAGASSKSNAAAYQELLDRIDAEYLQSQSADEMAALFERLEGLQPELKRFIDDITPEFGKILGGFRLIRAKDHDVEEQLNGNRYVGVGVNLSMNDSSRPPVFVMIRPGGPADRGGLKPNTYIHEIDGRSTEKVPQETILDWIRGPIGSDVTLKVSSDQSKEQRLVTLTRGLVRVESLKDRHRGSLRRDTIRFDRREPIGWITVETINGSTLHEFRIAEHQAKEDGIRVLVLDFRQTYHGINDLHRASLVADGFLDGGAIWEKADRRADSRIENADRECLFRDVLLVVVVDQTTSPTHCAIAAALQDAGRAKLVGEAPGFNGVISSTVRLSGVPYSLTMPTIRLNRARRDRQWPLEPDYSVAENTAGSVNHTEIPKGFRIGDRVILESYLMEKPSEIRRNQTANEPTKTDYPSASILEPQRSSITSNAVTQDRSSTRPVPTQKQNENFPIRLVPPKRKLEMDDVAILVALELQRGLTSASARPANGAQNSQSKDPTP